MSQPTSSDVHVNSPLTNLSIAFLQDLGDYIADRVFPMLPVAKQGDRYFLYEKEDWFRDEAQERAPGTESAGGGFSLDNTQNYFAKVIAYHKDVDDQVRANADAAINPDRDATEFATRKCLLKKEVDWSNRFLSPSVWGTDFTPATKWDLGGSTPIEDIRAQSRVIKRTTGFKPNKLVFTPDSWDVILDHPTVLDRIKFVQVATPGNVKAALADLFDVQEILVQEAVRNTAAKGVPGVLDHIQTKSALLVYSEPNPGLLKPTGGYTFVWSGLFGAQQGMRIKKFRIDEISSDRVECESSYDQKLVASELGVFFDGVLS